MPALNKASSVEPPSSLVKVADVAAPAIGPNIVVITVGKTTEATLRSSFGTTLRKKLPNPYLGTPIASRRCANSSWPPERLSMPIGEPGSVTANCPTAACAGIGKAAITPVGCAP